MRTRNRILAGLTTSAALLLVACGDDSSGDGVASLGDDPATTSEDDIGPGSSDMSRDDAMVAYSDCLSDFGIDVSPDTEDGSVSADGNGLVVNGVEVDPQVWERADEECQPLLEQAVGSFDIDPEEQARMLDEMTAIAGCLRDRGYDMPDPQVGDNGAVAVEVTDDSDGPGDPDAGSGPDGPDGQYLEDWEDCEAEAGLQPPSAGAGEDG